MGLDSNQHHHPIRTALTRRRTPCLSQDQYSSPAKPAGSAGSQHGLDGFGQQGFAARLERFRQALTQRRFALERTGRDAQGFEALGGENGAKENKAAIVGAADVAGLDQPAHGGGKEKRVGIGFAVAIRRGLRAVIGRMDFVRHGKGLVEVGKNPCRQFVETFNV